MAHLDGDPSNAVVSNLAYVTQKENESHKRVHGRATIRRGAAAPGAKLTEDDVREIRRLKSRFGEALPNWVLGQMFGMSKWSISDICTLKTYQNVT